MTTAEKLDLMERLWDELCRNPEDMPPPVWHRPILKERESMVRDGTDNHMDWEDAKSRIRESLD